MNPEPDYPRPIVTVDVVLMTISDHRLHVALQVRKADPHKGMRGLVGGWIHVDEDASSEAAAERVLRDKTGLSGIYVEQLRTFDGPGRDPRGWSASIAYLALVDDERLRSSPRADLELVPVDEAADGLAFDHGAIVRAAVGRLRGKGAYSTLPARLLPDEFTLGEMQAAYSDVMGEPLDKSSFRRKIADLGIVVETEGQREQGGRGKGGGGKLYRLARGASTFDRRI